MGTSRVRDAVTGEARVARRRVSIALGVGFLALAVVPVSIAVVVGLSGGPRYLAWGLLGVGVLGLVLLLVALPLTAVGVVLLLVGTAAAALEASVTERRLRVVRWASSVERTRWWGPIVRPSARLAFVDPLTADERFEREVDHAKAAYVAGDLTDEAFERRLDRLFEFESDEPPR